MRFVLIALLSLVLAGAAGGHVCSIAEMGYEFEAVASE